MKIYFKLILLLMLFSCQKLEDNKTENKEKFVLKEEDKRLIIDQYLVRLPEDSDFVKNFRLDRELSLLSGDSTGIASKADIEKLVRGLKKLKLKMS